MSEPPSSHRFYSLKIVWLGSLLLVGGVAVFSGGKVTRWRDAGAHRGGAR